MMKQLQAKLAGVGRTDDKLDAEVKAIEELAARWQAEEAAKRPKAKKPSALHVIKDGSGAGSNAASTLAKAKEEQ
jgi:hypothetical protein